MDEKEVLQGKSNKEGHTAESNTGQKAVENHEHSYP